MLSNGGHDAIGVPPNNFFRRGLNHRRDFLLPPRNHSDDRLLIFRCDSDLFRYPIAVSGVHAGQYDNDVCDTNLFVDRSRQLSVGDWRGNSIGFWDRRVSEREIPGVF